MSIYQRARFARRRQCSSSMDTPQTTPLLVLMEKFESAVVLLDYHLHAWSAAYVLAVQEFAVAFSDYQFDAWFAAYALAVQLLHYCSLAWLAVYTVAGRGGGGGGGVPACCLLARFLCRLLCSLDSLCSRGSRCLLRLSFIRLVCNLLSRCSLVSCCLFTRSLSRLVLNLPSVSSSFFCGVH